MSKLLWLVWLALLQSAFGFAIPNEMAFSPAHATKIICFWAIAYNEQNPAMNVYDVGVLADSDYDAAEVPIANDKENRTVGASSLFARFAKCLAAEGTMATPEGLIGISEHLTQLPGGGGIDAANSAMYSRLTTAFENGQALTGTDAAFYQHELLESSLMDAGMDARAAHRLALLEGPSLVPSSDLRAQPSAGWLAQSSAAGQAERAGTR